MTQNTKTIGAVILIGGGIFFLWQRRAQAQGLAEQQAAANRLPYGPGGLASPARYGTGTGTTNPLTMLLSGLSSTVTKLISNHAGAGNAPARPAAPAGAPGANTGSTRTPGAAPNAGAPGAPGGFLPASPGLLLPNLADPNNWFYDTPDTSWMRSQNVSQDLPYYAPYAVAPLVNLTTFSGSSDLALFAPPDTSFLVSNNI